MGEEEAGGGSSQAVLASQAPSVTAEPPTAAAQPRSSLEIITRRLHARLVPAWRGARGHSRCLPGCPALTS